MTNLLVKLFVKNSCNTTDPKVRENYGKLASIVCIVLNMLLSVGKIAVGMLFGAISVTADGFNNLTDCGSNIVSLVSFKVAGKPADKEHPYGHQRVEYISAMIVAFIVLMLAIELAKESFDKILNPTPSEISYIMLAVLGVSVLVKLWMFVFNRKLGNRVNSDVLKATATDSITDVIATTAVAIASVVSYFVNFNLDGFMGIAVAIVIAIAGIGILKDTMSKLLGQAPDKQLVDSIQARIMAFEGVLGIHDLTVHNYGPQKYYASVHVEVDASVPAMESHDLMDRIERDFLNNTDIILTIHQDPIITDDPQVTLWKEKVTEIVKSIDDRFVIHDFRAVKGVTHTNLIFDVAIPFDCKMSESEISAEISRQVSQFDDKLYVVATVEKQIS